MYGHCFNCQVDAETELRKQGTLEETEKQVTNDYIEGMTNDFNIWFEELIK